MLYKTEREIFPPAFKSSILATRMTGVMKRYLRTKELSELDKRVLQMGENYLSRVIEGEAPSETLEISERAMETSSAYGEALNAMYIMAQERSFEKSRIIDVFCDFKETVRSLRESGTVEQDKLSKTNYFFETLRIITAEDMPSPIENIEFIE